MAVCIRKKSNRFRPKPVLSKVEGFVGRNPRNPPETHVTVVADSAFLADFVVEEIRSHPTWSFVSSLDSNRKITVKRYTSHAIDFIMFKELKQYLHLGSYQFQEFEASMNHVFMVIQAYCTLKLLYPYHTIAEAKKIATESSQTVFLRELKHALTKFDGKKIVKSRIFRLFQPHLACFPCV